MKIKFLDLLDDSCKKWLFEMSESLNVPEHVLLNMLIAQAFKSFTEVKEITNHES